MKETQGHTYLCNGKEKGWKVGLQERDSRYLQGWIKVVEILQQYMFKYPPWIYLHFSVSLRKTRPFSSKYSATRLKMMVMGFCSDQFSWSGRVTEDSQKVPKTPTVSPTPCLHTKSVPHIIRMCLRPLPVEASVYPSSQPSLHSHLDSQSQILLPFLLGFQSHETT